MGKKYYTFKVMQWEILCGVCCQERIRNRHKFFVSILLLLSWGQLYCNSEQTHLQFEDHGNCRDFLDLVLAFYSVYGRKKHGHALSGILQVKPKHNVIFRSDFLKCLLKELSLSALHKNEPGNQILV